MAYLTLNTARNYFNALLHETPVLLSKCAEAIKNQSLFIAYNNRSIQDKYDEYKDLSWTQKFKLGLEKGTEMFVVGVLILNCFNLALQGVPEGKPASLRNSLVSGLVAGFVEEVVFRGILQKTVIHDLQEIAQQYTPEHLRNHYAIQWLTSPSARIAITNWLFAFVHFNNAGRSMSEKAALMVVLRVLTQPTLEILCETTGGLTTPIVTHMTQNFLGHLALRFFGPS